MDKVCDRHMDESLIPVIIIPLLSADPSKPPTNVKQQGSSFSKMYGIL